MEIRVKDHREAIDDFSKVQVSIDAIRLKPAGAWLDVKPELESFELTLYTEGRAVTVFKGELDSGPFEGMHLQLGKVSGTLKNGAEIEMKNSVGPIQLPISLHPKAATRLVIDLKVMDLSDHPGGTYELHPNAYELYRDGKLVDKAPRE